MFFYIDSCHLLYLDDILVSMKLKTEEGEALPVFSETQETGFKATLKRVSMANKKKNVTFVALALVVVLAGVGTGWVFSGRPKAGGDIASSGVAPGAKSDQKEAGLADESTFRDSAEGELKSGGIDGEGTHHLERDGGPSQYVYLTSTVIDLESFSDKKVMVWGETISAQKAGWLMDVGKIKVLD